MERVIAINCAFHSGDFKLDIHGGKEQGARRLEKLRELEKLDAQKAEVANKLRSEKQMGRQVDMNTTIKRITSEMDALKAAHKFF